MIRVHTQNTKLRKKACKEEQSCSSRFKNTKYTCSYGGRDTSVSIILSSRMTKGQTFKGWKAGSSVAYL